MMSDGNMVGSLALVSSAADFAAQRHAGQRRKGLAQEPYVNHLAEVAHLLARAGDRSSAQLIAAGWLHDTLEDTDATYEELEAAFGREIADIVAEVTDDKALAKAERKRRQIETVSRKSPAARMLKIADKTSNLRAIAASPPAHWDGARREEYISWASQVVAGCRGLSRELETVFDEAVALARESLGASPAQPASA